MTNQSIRSEMVNVKPSDNEMMLEGILVVEYIDAPFSAYWVHCGNLFNVVKQPNEVRVGYGAKKCAAYVDIAIQLFKQRKFVDDLAWSHGDRDLIRVVDGGLK